MDNEFITDYFKRYKLALDIDVQSELIQAKDIIISAKNRNNKLALLGNGGSNAIASHAVVDFVKQARVRAENYNNSAMITCFANDYGYEASFKKVIEFYTDESDVLIVISSSGNSENIIQAIKEARNRKMKVITFTGFDKNNPVKQLGDVNFWLDSYAYNIVENIHQIWLLAICDLIIGNAEYKA